VTLGTIELIVRDVDDAGKITSVGLSLEPAPAVASIPAFLSPVELIDRIRGFLKRRSGDGTQASEEAEKPDSYSSRGN
jgi:cell volume regulation protein A